jgi:Zn-dependent protease
MVPAAHRCTECGAEIAGGLLACPGCARLVHGAQLTELARVAETAERAGDLTTALASWRRIIELLPPGTVQRAKVEQRMAALSAAIDGRAPPPPGTGTTKKAGAAAGIGTVGLLLLKSKALLALLLANGKLLLVGLLKLPTLLSMLLYAQWTAGRGMGIGLGLIASIYVHEVGHVAALRRYGIDASPPMFVPGFGALVRMKQYPTDAHEEARTGLAGPLWGLVAVALAAIVGKLTASSAAISVASLSGTLNLFNLIPVWQLDGARGLRALSRPHRLVVAATGIVIGVALHQWMPVLVGLVAAARAFTRDVHPKGDRSMLATFVALVVLHALGGSLPVADLAN